MAGAISNIRRRNQRLNEAAQTARSARTGNSATSRPGPKVGAKTKVKRRGLRAEPARRMQTNMPVNRPQNRPQSISGSGRRQQQIRDIEARIKALGG